MKILYIVPYVPSLIRVRPYNFLRALVQQNHDLVLATLWSDPAELEAIQSLERLGVRVIAERLSTTRAAWNSLCALPGSRPIQTRYAWHPGLAAMVEAELRTGAYDVVHVEHLRGAAYGLLARRVLAEMGSTTPIVWDSVDSISHLFTQASQHSRSLKGKLVTRLELERTQRVEATLPCIFDRVLVTSSVDRTAFINLSDRPELVSQRIQVVPNGVDTDYFLPAAAKSATPTLVVSGKMSYHANVTMAVRLLREIMPLVWRARPDVRIWVVGKDPAPAIRTLAAKQPRHAWDGAAAPPRIVVTGAVPDMRPYLQQATLAVAPLTYGAGIQNKVLEAMACGTPVVASPSAVAALDIVEGRDLVIARDDEAFAAQILSLLDDATQRRRLAADGRAYVERHHSWDKIAARLSTSYQTVCNGKSSVLNSTPDFPQIF
jgi:glycosyltransferase involved in cell wall biosynthesis